MQKNTSLRELVIVRSQYVWVMVLAVLYGMCVLCTPSGIDAWRGASEDGGQGVTEHASCEDWHHRSHCNEENTGGDVGEETDSDTDTPSGGNATGTDTTTGTGDGTGSGGGGSEAHEVMVTIRTAEGIVYTGARTVPGTSASDVQVRTTDGASSVPVSAQSPLALLVALDEASDAFTTTDLQYYSAYQSFFLNCIALKGGVPLCGQWQYAVNGTYPSVGMDKYVLKDGDRLQVFFGSPRKVEVPASVRAGEAFTATAYEYDAEMGTYKPVKGYTIGVVQDDPANPYTPREVQTMKVSEKGEATFTVATSGAYKVGIKEDFYYPTSPLTVLSGKDASVSGGGAMLGGSGSERGFDTSAALAFIATYQTTNGSFGADMYTDWATIAQVAGGADTSRVRAYLLKKGTTFSRATDYERRAMALMALGVSPYDGTDVNYIDAIRAYAIEGQIGDPKEINDDIFALIVLERAGYEANDELVANEIAFLVNKQGANGAWDSSIDLTAATVQALAPFSSVAGVTQAMAKARAYLREAEGSDGGFGNSFTTAWVLQAIFALGDTPQDWVKNGATPIKYLASQQTSDGGMEKGGTDTTRLWATSYAVPAILGKTWREVLHAFTRPKSAVDGQGSSSTHSPTAKTTHATTSATISRVASTTGATTTHPSVQAGVPAMASSTPVPPQVLQKTAEYGARDSIAYRTENIPATTSSTTVTTDPMRDQLATTMGTGKGSMATALRMLTLVFALALVGFGVFTVRKW